jgi:threonine synthase
VFLTHLVCTLCGAEHDATVLQTVSTCCQKPLYAVYDLAAAGRAMTRAALAGREATLWRYREVLPPAAWPLLVGAVARPTRGPACAFAALF